MGKPTGFIEYLRELPVDRTPVERVKDWKEFHHHMEEKKLRYSLLRRGAIKLLHLAPERFFVRSEAERARLAELRPAFLVVAACNDGRPGARL